MSESAPVRGLIPLPPEEFLPRVLPVAWRRLKNPPNLHPSARCYRNDLVDLAVIVSVSVRLDGRRWLHVSASHPARCPSWETMCDVKDLFVGPDRVAVQVHPKASEYFTFHPHCLHLWSCLDEDLIPDLRNELGQL